MVKKQKAGPVWDKQQLIATLFGILEDPSQDIKDRLKAAELLSKQLEAAGGGSGPGLVIRGVNELAD